MREQTVLILFAMATLVECLKIVKFVACATMSLFTMAMRVERLKIVKLVACATMSDLARASQGILLIFTGLVVYFTLQIKCEEPAKTTNTYRYTRADAPILAVFHTSQ